MSIEIQTMLMAKRSLMSVIGITLFLLTSTASAVELYRINARGEMTLIQADWRISGQTAYVNIPGGYDYILRLSQSNAGDENEVWSTQLLANKFVCVANATGEVPNFRALPSGDIDVSNTPLAGTRQCLLSSTVQTAGKGIDLLVNARDMAEHEAGIIAIYTGNLDSRLDITGDGVVDDRDVYVALRLWLATIPNGGRVNVNEENDRLGDEVLMLVKSGVIMRSDLVDVSINGTIPCDVGTKMLDVTDDGLFDMNDLLSIAARGRLSRREARPSPGSR